MLPCTDSKGKLAFERFIAMLALSVSVDRRSYELIIPRIPMRIRSEDGYKCHDKLETL